MSKVKDYILHYAAQCEYHGYRFKKDGWSKRRNSMIYTKVPLYQILILNFTRISVFVEIIMFTKPFNITLLYLCRIIWRNYALN